MARLSRAASREQTRQRLRVAASEEFATYGVKAASIDRIAENAGFSRGAFYSNYDSKRDLLIEILQENVETEIAALQDLLAQSKDIRAFLPLMEKNFNRYTAQKKRWLLSAQLLMEAEIDPEFGVIYREYSARIVDAIRPLIVELLAKSPNTRSISPELLSIAFRTLSLGLMLESHRGGMLPDQTPGAIFARLLEHILY